MASFILRVAILPHSTNVTSKEAEAVGEHFVMASGGVFAFIGNSRYGWYMPGSTDGASQYYDRQFFRGLYEGGCPELGKALTFSREENLHYALSSDVMRWCYMEVLLFGDPSVAVKLPDQDLPMLQCDDFIFDDSLVIKTAFSIPVILFASSLV